MKDLREILEESLSREKAKNLVDKLSNLDIDLNALKELYVEPQKPSLFLTYCLAFIVIFHALIIITNLISVVVLPFVVPFYIAVPIMSLVINLTFSPIPCPLTRLESTVRRKMGLPEVRFFMKYYFIDPLRKQIAKYR